MKFAIDCRMIGSGGIGTYLESVLPYILRNYECLLFGNINDLNRFTEYKNAEISECSIQTFSLKELINFPKELLKKINQ